MSSLKQFIHEIHRRSLWQVLLIYIGGGWLVFEVVQTVTEGLGLPQWFPAFAALLLLIGLPVVVATAFVRDGEPATAVSDPTLIPVDEARSEAVLRRRFLTWRNATASFVVALAVWGMVAAGWMLFGVGEVETRAGAEGRPSVAALPFVNRSGLEEDEYFTDGIHDEILTLLSKISSLSVRGRTSVMQYRDTDKNVRQIGEELNARYVLEGGVQQAGGTVRINLQLLDAESDEHVWAETYDRPLTVENLLGVQSEVARRVTEALEATLTEEETARFGQMPTDNLEAYDYYLQGLEFMWRSFLERDILVAVRMFENATQLDSSFALAYAKLSLVHSRMYWYHLDRSEERLERAKQAVDRSLDLDSYLPEARLALGYYYYHGHLDYDRALQEFEAALTWQPGSVEILQGIGAVERRRGNFRVALTHFQNAVELSPRDPMVIADVAETQGRLLRNYTEAERHYNRVLALAPDLTAIHGLNAWLSIVSVGSITEARAALEEAADRGLDSVDNPFLGYAWVLVDIFDREYEAALTRLSSGSAVAFNNQWHYIPKALLAAQAYDLMNNPELARLHYDSAAAVLEARLREAPEDSRLFGALGVAHAGLGRLEDAVREGERGVDLLPVSKDAWRGLFRVEELALILTLTGQHDAAIDLIEFLLSVPGDMSVARLRLDPPWDRLRDHPRFQALLEKYE